MSGDTIREALRRFRQQNAVDGPYFVGLAADAVAELDALVGEAAAKDKQIEDIRDLCLFDLSAFLCECYDDVMCFPHRILEIVAGVVPAQPAEDEWPDCHTFPDGESFPALCQNPDCPSRVSPAQPAEEQR